MVTRYSSLVGVSIDTTELENRLDELESKLGDEAMTEDRVQEIFRDMAHDEGEQMVRDVISNEGYFTEDDVQTLVDRAVSDFIEEDDVERIVSDMGLDPDKVADAAEVDKLTDRVTALEKQADEFENKLNSLTAQDATAKDFFTLVKQAFALLQRG